MTQKLGTARAFVYIQKDPENPETAPATVLVAFAGSNIPLDLRNVVNLSKLWFGCNLKAWPTQADDIYMADGDDKIEHGLQIHRGFQDFNRCVRTRTDRKSNSLVAKLCGLGGAESEYYR